MRNAYMCMCASAHVDRLYFLSIYDDDDENARASLLPVYFESSLSSFPGFFLTSRTFSVDNIE
jgi:hypothetical protein